MEKIKVSSRVPYFLIMFSPPVMGSCPPTEVVDAPNHEGALKEAQRIIDECKGKGCDWGHRDPITAIARYV